MELSIHQTLCPTKGPLQDQPTPPQALSPSKKVMKIGGKDITFLLDGDPPATQSGSGTGGNVVRGRRGIGRGAGWCGKVGLDKIGGDLPQEGRLDSDWLGESGAEFCSMPIASEVMSSSETDWPRESEKMNSSSSDTSQPEAVPLDTDRADRNAGVVERVVYILRGCPGSGKSTLGRELRGETGCVFSTDDCFVGADGAYAFDPKKVAAFHKRTQELARAALSSGRSPVVVDNTNTTAWEMRPYVEMALRRGYRVEFVEPATPWRYDALQLSERNTHGVGLEAIRRMLKRFQKNVTVESVMGREAMKRIRAGSFSDQLIEDETNSNPELLSNSADDCRSVETSVSDGSLQDNESGAQEFESAHSQLEQVVSPPNVDLVKTEDSKSADFPTNQSTASEDHSLESAELTADKTDVLNIDTEKSADVDNQSEAGHDSPEVEEQLAPKKPIHKGAIVSNQERFNQQLISELSSRPNSVFCLNLQNIQVLEEIINIDKVLQMQSSFPLAQLLLPTHIRAQLTRTQVANFQHNYQRYIHHVLHGKRRDQSDASNLVSDTNQGVYSQAPMHTTQPLVTLPLVPTANISQPHGHSLASQPINSQPSVPIPVTSSGVNQQEMNSEMKPILPETNYNDRNLGDSKFPFQSTPITHEIKKSENQIKSIEPSFELESEASFQNGAENSPNRDDVIDNSSLDTLSPDKSTSTLENNSYSLHATENPEGIQSGEEIYSSETIPVDHSMQTTSHCIRKDSPFKPENLSDDQNKTNLNSSVDSTGVSVPTEVVFPGQLSRHNSDSEEMALATDTVFMENPPSVNTSSLQSPISATDPEKVKGFSEKIDWGDSSESELSSPNLVTSGTQAGTPENQLTPNSSNSELKQAPNTKPAAPWNTWSGWSSNFITPRTHEQLSPADQSGVVEAGRKKFDPTIQPPRKQSKGSTDIPNFTPSFSRFRSFEDPSEIPLPHSTRKSSLPPKSPSAIARPKWPTSDSSIKNNPHALLMPAGSEWQWGKATQSNTSKNEASETDDARNSKPLNPFAIPWKPIEPSTATFSDKLDHLKGFFPTLPLEELRAFLARNSNDVDRSVEAIIDQAETHNLDLPMSSHLPLPLKLAKRIRSPKKSDKVVTPLDATAPEFKTELGDTFETKWAQQGNDTSSESWTNQSPFKESVSEKVLADIEPQTKEFQGNATANYVTDTLEDTFSATEPTSPDPTLTLNLSSEVVSYLVKNFGPIPGYTPSSCLEKTQVILNEDSARHLHEIWCRGHAIQPAPFFPTAPPTPQGGAAWVPPEDPTEQAKLRIYGMYPGIDTATLDQILATKNFSLSAANNFIQAALNSAKTPQQNVVPSFAHVAKRTGAQSFPPLPSKSHPRPANPLFSPNTAKPSF